MATDHDELDPRLREAISGLRDREPDSDLWPGISRRIAPPRPGTIQLRWPIAAAAAVALVAGSAVVTRQLVQSGPVAARETGTPIASHAGSVTVLPAGFDLATASLSDAIAQVEDAFAEVAPSLDSATRASIAGAIRTLDAAIADASARAGAAPDDIDAARYLTRTMQRKLRVLQSVTTLTRAT